jgi:DNA adenine methylase
MKPKSFIKWPGGKHWLARRISRELVANIDGYFEPFLGSAALFFSLQPHRAILSDCNGELINVFVQVRDNVEGIINKLEAMTISKDFFYRMRSWKPETSLEKAARFLYLNRTAFNGMYRVNRNGDFNVPFGCKPFTKLCDKKNLRESSIILKNTLIYNEDFEVIVMKARKGDLIYFDPPYTAMHDNGLFRRFNESLFSWNDQERLANTVKKLEKKGIHVIVSNAHVPEILSLYRGMNYLELDRVSCISGKSEGRRIVREYLFYSNDLDMRYFLRKW